MDPFAAEAERPIKIPPYFDGIFYPPGMEAVSRRLAVVRANRYIGDNNNFLIAYAWHPASNTRELAEYAQRKEKTGRSTLLYQNMTEGRYR